MCATRKLSKKLIISQHPLDKRMTACYRIDHTVTIVIHSMII